MNNNIQQNLESLSWSLLTEANGIGQDSFYALLKLLDSFGFARMSTNLQNIVKSANGKYFLHDFFEHKAYIDEVRS